MTSKYPRKSLTVDRDCPVCNKMVTDGVVLECGHTACVDCFASNSQREGRIFCSKCWTTVEQRKPQSSHPLEDLLVRGVDPKEEKKGKKGQHPFCQEHQEEVKLFCETERKLICVNCLDRRDENSHTSHNFMLVNEAIDMYKEKINTIIFSLKQKKTSFQDFELKQQETISEIKEQSNKLQALIFTEFSKLRSLLDEKERILVKELNEEKDDILGRMETNLREIQGNSQDTQQKVSDIEMQLNTDDGITLLMENMSVDQSNNEEDYQPKITEGSLTLGAFKGPTQYRVWKQVIDMLNPGMEVICSMS
ncbi:hypothetical protein chiPu_0012161 [Chiloscyllium punctatum]|uniref:B box-type domain-containing protein n=1 Tax=Chiloscyllium punctatum TaxID=137246 RepID=A0A401STH4_CHIPU|nr:hypothetical protein [Chiloscyllium punctatum]